MSKNTQDDKLIRIEDKIDHLVEKIGSIDSTLASQHESLKDHIRRTELLENMMTPVQKHVIIVNGVIKLIVFIATLGAGIEGFILLLEFLKK